MESAYCDTADMLQKSKLTNSSSVHMLSLCSITQWKLCSTGQ